MKKYYLIAMTTALIVIFMSVGGCEFKVGESTYGLTKKSANYNKNTWSPVVRSLSIYPSTHTVRTSDGPKLRVTIQLVDVMGDCLKAPGRLRLALFKATDSNNSRAFLKPGSELDQWQVSLDTLKDQKKYYSPITRGYLFNLNLSSTYALDNPVLLRATFITLDGKRIKVQRKLPVQW